jgi:hypothetical protein
LLRQIHADLRVEAFVAAQTVVLPFIESSRGLDASIRLTVTHIPDGQDDDENEEENRQEQDLFESLHE